MKCFINVDASRKNDIRNTHDLCTLCTLHTLCILCTMCTVCTMYTLNWSFLFGPKFFWSVLSLISVQSIPEKDLQGFCFQDSHIALSTHFSWQVEYGRHEIGNLVNLSLELTVHMFGLKSLRRYCEKLSPMYTAFACGILANHSHLIEELVLDCPYILSRHNLMLSVIYPKWSINDGFDNQVHLLRISFECEGWNSYELWRT